MGIMLVLAASCFMVGKDVVSKSLATDLKGTQSAFASFFFSMPWYFLVLISLYMLGYEDFGFQSGFLLLVLARSITDTFAETFRMQSFRHGELSQVSAFISLNPIFIIMIEPFLVGDRLSGLEVAGVLLSLVGGLIVIYQPWKQVSRQLLFYGTFAALFFALNSCFDRLSVGKGSPTLAAALMTGLSTIILLPFIIRGDAVHQLKIHIKPLLIRGIFELLFMILKLSALVYLPASKVSAVMRGTLIFSVVAGALFFKEDHFLRKCFGAALTLIGLILAFQ